MNVDIIIMISSTFIFAYGYDCGSFDLHFCHFTIDHIILIGLTNLQQYFLDKQNEDIQQQIIKETFQLVSKRDDNVCNFLEGGSLIGGSDYKLIYRHYATLYFVFCVDSSESELGILDLIQVFVETLDKCFENVCELDLIFHADSVHHILAELVMGKGGVYILCEIEKISHKIITKNGKESVD